MKEPQILLCGSTRSEKGAKQNKIKRREYVQRPSGVGCVSLVLIFFCSFPVASTPLNPRHPARRRNLPSIAVV
ncbi:MAG: hypothetical protein RR842_03675 [Gordonibacter sp.]